MNRTGIILTTFDNLEMTKNALRSLIEHTKDYDLVIVDCASKDGTQEWVKQQGINIIEFKEYVSLTEALNAGIRYFFEKENNDVHYDICWIHNDMTFQDGWLDALRKYLEDHIECGRVASQNTRDEILGERSGNELPCLIRGHVLKQIGLFDERFMGIGGFEDWDLNKRIVNDNWTVMITPTSRVYHVGMGTRSQRNTDSEAQYNSGVYYSKWHTYDCPV